ncbi:hypothetical protein C8R46DRAFT_1274797 [Mycena filopes]|nr:hypothetical protein C8R46DRAFT_1274797 [Mycena filopes]
MDSSCVQSYVRADDGGSPWSSRARWWCLGASSMLAVAAERTNMGVRALDKSHRSSPQALMCLLDTSSPPRYPIFGPLRALDNMTPLLPTLLPAVAAIAASARAGRTGIKITIHLHGSTASMLTRREAENCARRAAIDSELVALRERIDSLNAERNSMAQITVLPNEMLVEIFSAVTVLGDYDHGCESNKPLTRLMPHALSLGPPSLTSQLLRTGLAPVRIRIPLWDSWAYAPRLIPHAARIQSLDLFASGGGVGYLSEFIQDMAELDFPTLRSLTLSTDDQRSNLNRRLPRAVLEGRLPLLADLSLMYIEAPWECLPPLQSLCLVHNPAAPITLTLDVLLTFLQSSPALHTLKLDSMIQPGSVESSHLPKLPLLKLLYLREDLSNCEAVLDRILFPAAAQVQLIPRGIHDGADISHILIPLRQHLHAPHAPRATSLTIHSSITGNYFLAGLYPDAATSISINDTLFMINSHPTSVSALQNIMTKVLNAMPMQGITHLQAGDALLTAPTWKAAFALMPALESVHIRASAGGRGFCEAAMDARLMLRSVVVTASVLKEEGPLTVHMFFTALIRLLRLCDEAGKCLGSLHVKDYYRALTISDETETDFRNLVDVVVIDRSSM